MKRTVEKVLTMAAIICSVLGIGLMSVIIFGIGVVFDDPNTVEEIVVEQNQTGQEQITVEEMQEAINVIQPFVNTFGWVIVALLVISVVLGIIAFVYLMKNKSMNTTGGLLIAAGVLSGLISITSILYYIAAIMCFVRKPKPTDQTLPPMQ